MKRILKWFIPTEPQVSAWRYEYFVTPLLHSIFYICSANLMKPVAFRVGLLGSDSEQILWRKICRCNGDGFAQSRRRQWRQINRSERRNGHWRWEELATELANTSDANLAGVLSNICGEMKINFGNEVKVAVGRDTRPSGPIELCDAIGKRESSASHPRQHSSIYYNYKLRLSVISLFLNWTRRTANLTDILNTFPVNLSAFWRENGSRDNLLLTLQTELALKVLKLFVWGSPSRPASIRQLWTLEKKRTRFWIINVALISSKSKWPRQKDVKPGRMSDMPVWTETPIVWFTFYFDSSNRFKMLDGDRISVLFAFICANCSRKPGCSNAQVWVVQTALRQWRFNWFLWNRKAFQFQWPVRVFKNLHHVAAEDYDIGVYFEANGHGTVLFGPRACEALETNHSAWKLKLVKELVNQCVGDAMSDLLFVEAILCEEECR